MRYQVTYNLPHDKTGPHVERGLSRSAAEALQRCVLRAGGSGATQTMEEVAGELQLVPSPQPARGLWTATGNRADVLRNIEHATRAVLASPKGAAADAAWRYWEATAGAGEQLPDGRDAYIVPSGEVDCRHNALILWRVKAVQGGAFVHPSRLLPNGEVAHHVH